jgi:hypothetical protein
MKKPEQLDCVAVKRRAQRALAKVLAGKSPEEQAETLRRMAGRTPLWNSLAKGRAARAPSPAAPARRRRSTG